MKATVFAKVRRGFTLIELLVVIAIIGTLAAIATPIYLSFMDNARTMDSRKHCTDIANGIENFKRDNNGQWPLKDVSFDEEVIVLTTVPGKDGGLLEVLAAREKGDDRLNTNRYAYIRGDVNETPRDGIYEDKLGELGFYDPWGNPYTVMITDLEDDGIADPFTGKPTRKQVLVYGNGADGKVLLKEKQKKQKKKTRKPRRTTRNSARAAQTPATAPVGADESVNEDNVCSWKKNK